MSDIGWTLTFIFSAASAHRLMKAQAWEKSLNSNSRCNRLSVGGADAYPSASADGGLWPDSLALELVLAGFESVTRQPAAMSELS